MQIRVRSSVTRPSSAANANRRLRIVCNTAATFSAKFESEEELLASKRISQDMERDLTLSNLNKKLASLRDLSAKLMDTGLSEPLELLEEQLSGDELEDIEEILDEEEEDLESTKASKKGSKKAASTKKSPAKKAAPKKTVKSEEKSTSKTTKKAASKSSSKSAKKVTSKPATKAAAKKATKSTAKSTKTSNKKK